jgi:DNA invertase Pin-like site-specific DNA recombinase
MSNIAYIRVSTEEQNEARQLEAMQDKHIDEYFTEKVSGKNTDRPKLQEMLKYVRKGDIVYVHDFSRLARSTKDLLNIIDQLEAKGVHLVSNKEQFDTSTPQGRLMITMLGAIYEFERQNMLDRQAEGIKIAKENGKYKGRKKTEIESDTFKKYYDKYMKREINKVEFAKAIKVSRPTLDNMLKEYNA